MDSLKDSVPVVAMYARTWAVLSALVLTLGLLIRWAKPISAEDAGFAAALFFAAVCVATLFDAFRRGPYLAAIATSTFIFFTALNYAAVRYGLFAGL